MSRGGAQGPANMNDGGLDQIGWWLLCWAPWRLRLLSRFEQIAGGKGTKRSPRSSEDGQVCCARVECCAVRRVFLSVSALKSSLSLG